MLDTKQNHIFIDGSNLFIEGMRLSSQIKSGDTSAPAYLHQEFDFDFRIDLRRLRDLVGDGAASLTLVGSRSFNSDLVFEAARKLGFATIELERDGSNREKAVDMMLAMGVMARLWSADPSLLRVVLVAGDRDYVPLVRFVRARGFDVEVAFWGHAAKQLREAATTFHDLDPHFDQLRWQYLGAARTLPSRDSGACVNVPSSHGNMGSTTQLSMLAIQMSDRSDFDVSSPK